MSGSTARRAAVTAAINYTNAGPPLDYKETPATTLFGTNVFGLATMKSTLPKEVFKSLKKTIETGSTLDPKIADVVAAASLAGIRSRIRRVKSLGSGSTIGLDSGNLTRCG